MLCDRTCPHAIPLRHDSRHPGSSGFDATCLDVVRGSLVCRFPQPCFYVVAGSVHGVGSFLPTNMPDNKSLLGEHDFN